MTFDPPPDYLGMLRACLDIDRVLAELGGVPAGEEFALSLEKIVNSPLCQLPRPIYEAALSLCTFSRAHRIPHTPRRHGQVSPVDGLRTHYPNFCSVVFNGTPDDLWIRVALLEGLISSALPPGQRAGMRQMTLSGRERDRLAALVYKPPPRRGDKFNDAIRQYSEVLHKLAGRIRRLPRLPDEALGAENPEDRERTRSAVLNAFAYLAGISGVGPVPNVPPADTPNRRVRPDLYVDPRGTFMVPPELDELLRSDPEAPPLSDFCDPPILLRPPAAAEILEEEGEDVELEAPLEQPIALGARAARREAESAHLLFLTGSLQPEVVRVLSPPVYSASMEFILDRMVNSEEPSEQCAWLILLLSGLTSRHHQEVAQALKRYATSTDSAAEAFQINVDGYWTRSPLGLDAASRSRSPTLYMPWPTTVADSFRRLRSSHRDWDVLVSRDLAPAVRDAAAVLRAKVYPLFSLVRLRNTLPSAVYAGGADRCLAQIVCGDTLRHSDAPLHYYSNLPGRMRRQVAWAVGAWLPRKWSWHISPRENDDEVFGLPRCCLPQAEVRAAVTALAHRADSLPPPRATPAELCEFHNQFTAYSVAMFSAGTTHRQTEHLGDLTRRQLVLRWAGNSFGVATFLDKYTVNALSSRAAVVSPMVVTQLEIYLAHLARMVQRLEKLGRKNRRAIEALRAAISGEGTLFLVLENDGTPRETTRVRPFASKDLSALWPEWGRPGYVLRHRFASSAWRVGIAPDDIARQMGHAIDGVAFDEGDPDSVIRFAERLAAPPGEGHAAPLDRLLTEDGWRIARSWMPVRFEVPPAAQDESRAVVAEQYEIQRVHQRLQASATARSMGKSLIVDSSRKATTLQSSQSIFEGARSIVQIKLDEWLGLPAQDRTRAAKVLIPDDVEALTHYVMSAQPDRKYLVPMMNVLRNRLQRMRDREGWTVPLPSPICVLYVAPPVITPACARAYNHCVRVLSSCERWIMSEANDGCPEAIKWLGATAIQMSLRNGINRLEVLREVLIRTAECRRHPLLPDTILVPVSSAFRTKSEDPGGAPGDPDSTARDNDPRNEADEAGQYVVVQGLAAICYLRWSSMRDGWPEERVKKELAAAVGQFSDIAVATGEDDRTAGGKLADFLQCAQLARRLTMPGPRSAWEEGRIRARTVDLKRQMEIWEGRVRRVNNASPGDVVDLSTKASGEIPSKTAEVLRRVRSIIHVAGAERGRPRSGESVVRDIEDMQRRLTVVPLTAQWLLRYVVVRLKDSKGQRHRNTLYQDFTNFLEPFLGVLGEEDLSGLESDAVAAVMEGAVHASVDPKRAMKVVRGLIREMVRDGYDSPEMVALHAISADDNDTGPAYLVSPEESEWISGQLSTWLQEQGPYQDLAFDSYALKAARQRWSLQYWTGLRTVEATHLRQAEVIEIGKELILIVRRTRRRGLKTDASVRVLRLAHYLPEEKLHELAAFVRLQRTAHPRGEDLTVGLFARPDAVDRIADDRGLNEALRAAMALILPPFTGRPYVGRHVQASYGLQAHIPQEHRSPCWRRDSAPAVPSYVANLPMRYGLRFWSRGLGHARISSSLEFYSHSLADMRFLDRALPSTTQGLLAAAAGVKSSTLAVRVLRAGGRDLGMDGRTGVLIDALGADRSQVTHPEYPEFEKDMRAAGGATLIEDTLQWVKPWLAGEHLGVLDHRYGRGIEWMRRLAQAIERLDHFYRAGIVDRTIPLDEIDQKLLKLGSVKKGRRGPKLRDALVLARGLDQLAKAHPREWQAFLSAARLQRRGLEEVNLAAVQGLNISQYPEGRSRALVVLIALAIDDVLRQLAT